MVVIVQWSHQEIVVVVIVAVITIIATRSGKV